MTLKIKLTDEFRILITLINSKSEENIIFYSFIYTHKIFCGVF